MLATNQIFNTANTKVHLWTQPSVSFNCLVPHNRSSGIHLNVISPTNRHFNLSYSKKLYHKVTYNFHGSPNRDRPTYPACCKYARTPTIRIKWDSGPTGYAKNPDNWTFF